MDSYYQRNQRPHRQHKKHKRHWQAYLILVLIAYAIWCLFRPLAPLALAETATATASEKPDSSLAWPAGTEAAIGTLADGVLATSSASQQPLPTASIAKLITALTILNKFPLATNEEGPIITLGASDVALFNKYYAEGGSLVKVAAGEQISEHQAIEAMLLPSANNMADSLAIWAFGSLKQYQIAGQNEANTLGLTHTTVGVDASGFDPSTTSTPSDLIKLGQAVMANQLLAQIVGEKTAIVPVAGEIKNVNYTLGSGGFIGIKTGNSDQAGGNFLFATTYAPGKNHPQIILGAIMHAPDVITAMHDALPLVAAAQQQIKIQQVVAAGQTVASLSAPWLSKPVPANARQTLTLAAWQGEPTPEKVQSDSFSSPTVLKPGGSIASGEKVGSVTFGRDTNTQTTALVASQNIPAPSIPWRLTHPF